MSDADQAISWRVLRQRLFLAGLTERLDADPAELGAALQSQGLDADDAIAALCTLVGADGVWAARESLTAFLRSLASPTDPGAAAMARLGLE